MSVQIEALVLAETFGKHAEKYTWYPRASKSEIQKIQEELRGTDACYKASVTIYCLEGDGHKPDFDRWKDALQNRSQTFQRKGFLFHNDNIEKLEPKGFIIFARAIQ